MGSISTSPELSLDLNPTFIPRTISAFLKEISKIGNVSDKSSKLDEYVKRLEEEMKKIDAFKRELPLCMLLLNDAIVTLKSSSSSVMEDFIPIKRNCGDEDVEIKKEKDSIDHNKMNWMSSAQLWSSNGDDDHSHEKRKSVEKDEQDDPSAETEEMNTFSSSTCSKHKNGGGAFMPFKGFPPGFPVTMTMMTSSTSRKEDKEVPPPPPLLPLVPSLSLLTPGIVEQPTSSFLNSRTRVLPTSSTNTQSNLQIVGGGGAHNQHQQQQQPPRKQRRCWSPDLHRRFVSALQQLGGSQVATPKQIRELMKVDGLTNDEVKSHLQKYRLHTRRLPNASSTSPANQQAVVVLGGLWVSQDQYGTSKSNTTSQSESPQGPLQLSGAGGGVSTTGTTGDDSMEDEEDERSESHSWKGHQQQNSGETDK